MVPDFFVAGIACAFGAIVGSFLNVCIHRLPRNQSIVWPGSRCAYCKSPIRPRDNIPLLSFLILSGRCRQCSWTYSWRYPLVELLGGVIALWALLSFGLHWMALFYFVLLCALLVVVVVDIEFRIIPDQISLGGLAIALIAPIIMPIIVNEWLLTFSEALIGVAVGGGALYSVGKIYSMLTGQEGIGFGDVKLMALFGALFGWRIVVTTLFIGSFSGAAVGLAAMALSGRTMKYPIPFGPFLVLGLLVSLWQERLVELLFPAMF